MSRTYSRYANKEARELLATLARRTTPPLAYREAMLSLGRLLGKRVDEGLRREKQIALVCGVEDVDFLALGLLTALEAAGRDVRLVCFWNARLKLKRGEEVAPIVRRYAESPGQDTSAVVVVKSIISTACVVRTNLMDFLDHVRPRQILVAAPVLFRGAQKSLEQEFPREVAEKFSYLYFAIDSRRTSEGIVMPGIGGMVYERLGIGTAATKNSYQPKLIRERRAAAERRPSSPSR